MKIEKVLHWIEEHFSFLEIRVFEQRKIILRRHFRLVSKIAICYLNEAKFMGYDANEKVPSLDRGTFSVSS